MNERGMLPRYWACERHPECGLVIEGRSIFTCQACWAEILEAEESGVSTRPGDEDD